ncbi:MAG: hypothetical protein H6719_28795 [Sandaracinaceae bacterium]|nr:hypothetical protein [Sandaracinaceae bacterium]
MRWIVFALLAAGCGSAPEAPACAGGTWGDPAFDALDALNDPDLLERDDAARRRFARQLDEAARHAPPTSTVARVTLQNDVWGVWQRARAEPASSPSQHAIEVASARLVRRLALARIDAPWREGLPELVSTALGRGWREQESELPSLQHERAFGLRRVFHVARRGDDERALFSTLVALDARGRPHVTRYVGDLEVLRFERGELREARVYELDRRATRCEGAEHAMRPLDAVSHVPGTGAHRFVADFDPPAPLASLPCARCHDDDSMMSLPSAELGVGSRFEALLAPAREEGVAIADADP